MSGRVRGTHNTYRCTTFPPSLPSLPPAAKANAYDQLERCACVCVGACTLISRTDSCSSDSASVLMAGRSRRLEKSNM